MFYIHPIMTPFAFVSQPLPSPSRYSYSSSTFLSPCSRHQHTLHPIRRPLQMSRNNDSAAQQRNQADGADSFDGLEPQLPPPADPPLETHRPRLPLPFSALGRSSQSNENPSFSADACADDTLQPIDLDANIQTDNPTLRSESHASDRTSTDNSVPPASHMPSSAEQIQHFDCTNPPSIVDAPSDPLPHDSGPKEPSASSNNPASPFSWLLSALDIITQQYRVDNPSSLDGADSRFNKSSNQREEPFPSAKPSALNSLRITDPDFSTDNDPSIRDDTDNTSAEGFLGSRFTSNRRVHPSGTGDPVPADGYHDAAAVAKRAASRDNPSAIAGAASDKLQSTDIGSAPDDVSADEKSFDDSAAKDSVQAFSWLLFVLNKKAQISKTSEATRTGDTLDTNQCNGSSISNDQPSRVDNATTENWSHCTNSDSGSTDDAFADGANTDDKLSDNNAAEDSEHARSWPFSFLWSNDQSSTACNPPPPTDAPLGNTRAEHTSCSDDSTTTIDTNVESYPSVEDRASLTDRVAADAKITDNSVVRDSKLPLSRVSFAVDRSAQSFESGDTVADDALDEDAPDKSIVSLKDNSAAVDASTEELQRFSDSATDNAPTDDEGTNNLADGDSKPSFSWLFSLLSTDRESPESPEKFASDEIIDSNELSEHDTPEVKTLLTNGKPLDSDGVSGDPVNDDPTTEDSAPVSWLFSIFENGTEAPAEKLRKLLHRKSADFSKQAAVAALRAVGLEPLDTSGGGDFDVSLPRRPFDPVLALVLAGYAFRAYYDPPRSAYYEGFAMPVAGSVVSGLERQFVYTEFAYMDAGLIACRADGMFMLHVCEMKGLDNMYVTAEVNSTIVEDIAGKRSVSVLRVRDARSALLCELFEREEDMLVLNLFASKRKHEEGKSPIYSASVSLAEIVKKGLERRTIVDGPQFELKFDRVREEKKNRDFFSFSLLPKELKLPFQKTQSTQPDGVAVDEKKGDPLSISLQVSFVPFPERQGNERAATSELLRQRGESTSLTVREGVTSEDLMPRERIKALLKKELLPGQLPNSGDWSRLATVAKSVIKHIGELVGFERSGNVAENLPGSIFIESLSTDTEVWLFHDEAEKSIIISFRGTEQGSWRDFFTDAQVFLQRWAPGEEVNLNVDTDTTVGLYDLVPGIMPTAGSTISEDASAVHYGFLRAFLSIRDAVTRGINLLSSDLSEGYSLHFTGHSLGGALAILAAADFQAKHLFDNHNVTCMSFGAPKVGNTQFAKLYNRLVPNSFRIVNDADLISRMPRSLTSGNPLGRYKHAGRTVLINEHGDYWMEGHVDTKSFDRMAPLEDPFRERYTNISDLFAFEQGLWSELLSGRSVRHHMVSEALLFVICFHYVQSILTNTLYHISVCAFCRRTRTSLQCREFCRSL